MINYTTPAGISLVIQNGTAEKEKYATEGNVYTITKAEEVNPSPYRTDPRIKNVAITRLRGNGSRAHLDDENNFWEVYKSGWEFTSCTVSFCAKVYEHVRSVCRFYTSRALKAQWRLTRAFFSFHFHLIRLMVFCLEPPLAKSGWLQTTRAAAGTTPTIAKYPQAPTAIHTCPLIFQSYLPGQITLSSLGSGTIQLRRLLSLTS